MVPNKDRRPRGQVLVPANNLEADARAEAHGPFESLPRGPLGDAVVADEAEGDGGEDAVEGAGAEEAVRDEEAEEEGGGRLAEGGHAG